MRRAYTKIQAEKSRTPEARGAFIAGLKAARAIAHRSQQQSEDAIEGWCAFESDLCIYIAKQEAKLKADAVRSKFAELEAAE